MKRILQPVIENIPLFLISILLMGGFDVGYQQHLFHENTSMGILTGYMEIIFMAYMICLISYLCRKIYLKVLFYIVLFMLYGLSCYLLYAYSAYITPNILLLLFETNSKEVTGFFQTYLMTPAMFKSFVIVGFLLVLTIVGEIYNKRISRIASKPACMWGLSAVLLLGAIGCPKPEKIFASHWFTTRNFHGMWYSDGDKLEEYLHFRANVPIKEYFKQLAHSDSLPAGLKYAVRSKLVYASHLVPHIVKLAMYAMATSKEHGTQWWIKHRKEQRIHAYYGSMEKYKAIPDWKEMDLSHNSEEERRMNHGYDEQKPLNMLTLEDLQQAAAFRGGKCLGPVEEGKNGQALIDTPMQWQCAEGHEFIATPRLILLGGHWCPECFPFPYDEKAIAGLKKQLAQTDAEGKAISAEERLQVLGSLRERPWQWDKESKRNPFFAQLWAPLHDADEDNIYSSEVFTGWE